MPTCFPCRRNYRLVLAAVVVGIIATACTSATQRLHPDFPVYRQPMRTMLVIAPKIDIFETLTDGSPIYRRTLSRDAQRAAQHAVISQLEARRFAVRTPDADDSLSAELSDIASLFRSVNRSIQLHTIGPQVFPRKRERFDYRIGSVTEVLDTYAVDGLVLVLGHQTGLDRPDRNWISIAVVEPQGRIVWYGLHGDHDRFDIHVPSGMEALVATTMADFWESGS